MSPVLKAKGKEGCETDKSGFEKLCVEHGFTLLSPGGQTLSPARLGGPAVGPLPHSVHIAQQARKTCLY